MNLQNFLSRIHLGGIHDRFELNDGPEGSECFTRTDDGSLVILANGSSIFDLDEKTALPIYEVGKMMNLLALTGEDEKEIVFDKRTGTIPEYLKLKSAGGRSAKFMFAASDLFDGTRVKMKADAMPDLLTEDIEITSDVISTLKKACSALKEENFSIVLGDDGVEFRVGAAGSNNFRTIVQENIDWKVAPTQYDCSFRAAPLLAIAEYNKIDSVKLQISDKLIMINVEDISSGDPGDGDSHFVATYVLIRFKNNLDTD